MWQSNTIDFSLEKVFLLEEVREFLNELAAQGNFSLRILDENDQPLVTLTGNGTETPSEDLSGNASPRPEGVLLVQEIVFLDQHMGKILGTPAEDANPEPARRILQLAAKWIEEKLAAEYNTNSLSAEILNNYEELNLLYEICEEIASVFDPHEVCEIVLRKALSVIGAEKASIFLWNSAKQKLQMMASVGLPSDVEEELFLEANKGICGYVFKNGKPLLVEEMEDLPKELAPGAGDYNTESFVSVPMLVSPMKVKEKIIGVINLADKPAHRPYHAGDLKLLSAISSQAALSVHNSFLIEDLKKNERFLREMEIAEAVQKNLLPRDAPQVTGIQLAGCCVPAKEVGGDYYDYFPLPGEGVGLVVADVSGHSISSGIMMAITRGLLKSEDLHTRTPSEVLTEVNRSLFADLVSSELFITMAYFSFEPKRRILSFANGGHNPSLLLRADSTDVELLDADGMGIGFMEDVEFEEKTYQLARDDILVIYTDGVVEAENEAGEQFGMDRFLERLQKLRHGTTGEILDGLYKAVMEHLGGSDPHSRQQDDITLVVLKVEE